MELHKNTASFLSSANASMSNQFVPGQRWINDAQLQLGLGSVIKTDLRTVTILFIATGETFVYAKESVPLTRVRFAVGDNIMTLDEITYTVIRVEDNGGRITYIGRPINPADNPTDNPAGEAAGNPREVRITEENLSHFIQLSRPSERLFNGQIDTAYQFDLRYQTRRAQSRLAANPIRGLSGGRVSIIPHQIYIASTVAKRFAPRVLLADEVGLGKTIEAGMIVHQQLITERANRVLIVVPESLVYQWLVEMRRRFNLMFAVFDQDRYARLHGIEAADADEDEYSDSTNALENPFSSEQLVLCSLEFLASQPQVFKHCRDAKWDLMVVDEAHHLHWSEDDPGFEYQLIAQLAQHIKGVLLLTATPEQLGKAGHYARLRLLDSDRFADFDEFVREENSYKPIAEIVEWLLDESPLGACGLSQGVNQGLNQGRSDQHKIKSLLQYTGLSEQELGQILHEPKREKNQENRENLINQLLDRHGTGRVLFRNTRSTVSGFPMRKINPIPVALPPQYAALLAELQSLEALPKISGGLRGEQFLSDAQLLLCPELLYSAAHENDLENDHANAAERWTQIDSRILSLYTLVRELSPEKVLVVTASADTAMELAAFLKAKHGMEAAVFHEHLSMLERDRAAAWFADQFSGARLMICSEIGSEGRNFQFAHHLALFDLPLNPDLLEQRIGRLDRIGQQQTIHIHVIYLENSAQEFMFNWYHHGLNAFEQTCPTGFAVFRDCQAQILTQLHQSHQQRSPKQAKALIAESRALYEKYTAELQAGRDRLLEFNSCRPAEAKRLCDQINALALEQNGESGLQSYMERVFDCFGIDTEIHSKNCYVLHACPHSIVSLPQLKDGGMTVTYHRETALTFEDIDFLTWEHPLVTGAMDRVLSNEVGNTSVIAAPLANMPRGSIVLETIFILEPYCAQGEVAARFLSPTILRIAIDQNGKRLDTNPSINTLNRSHEKLTTTMIRQILRAKETLLRKMLQASENLVNKLAPPLKQRARELACMALASEVDRLKALRAVNPNVRPEEIEFLERHITLVNQQLDDAVVRLDAMRVIVCT